MKRFRIDKGYVVTAVIAALFHLTIMVWSGSCWGADETASATVQDIARNITSQGTKTNGKSLTLAVQTVLKESLRYGVDYRLVLAIMKVESNFRHNVVSPDGARGLMQIQPSLAKEIAKESGIPYSGLKDLFDPQKNIRIGIYYISKLTELFNDLPTVLFAYNVGHNKAKMLLAEDKDPHTAYTKRVIEEYKKNTKKMINL